MNTIHYTPGPWYHTITRGEQRVQRVDIDGVTDICTVHQLDYAGASHTEHYGNCTLIAVAPAMVEALLALYNCPAMNMDDLEPTDHQAMDGAREILHHLGRVP